MYCQTSSSVQLLIGNTRTCSPAVHARVVQIPQLGALVLRIPLAELVAEREHALLCARLLLVAPRAADAGVETEFGDGFEQRHRLRGVAAVGRAAQPHRAAADRFLDRAHDQSLAELGHAAVAELDHLGKVVPGVDVQQTGTGIAPGETPSRRAAAAPAESLPPENSSAGLRALAGHFAQDEDRFGLEPVEMAAPRTACWRLDRVAHRAVL